MCLKTAGVGCQERREHTFILYNSVQISWFFYLQYLSASTKLLWKYSVFCFSADPKHNLECSFCLSRNQPSSLTLALYCKIILSEILILRQLNLSTAHRVFSSLTLQYLQPCPTCYHIVSSQTDSFNQKPTLFLPCNSVQFAAQLL